MTAAPYLFFNGNCEQALRFYEAAAGAQLGPIHRYGDAPPNAGPGGGPMCPPESAHLIMNAEFSIGASRLLASDCPPGAYKPLQGFSLCIYAADPAEAERVFTALSAGGKVTMPLSKTFFAKAFGMLTDPFGIPWMVIAQ